MRETCARVLAAALMTGAIGFALAMPALVGTSRDAVRSLTAPPSSLQRSVHVVAAAPPRPVRAGRLEGTGPTVRAVPAAAVRASGRHPNHAREPRSAPRPAPSPTPQPAPATDTRTLADETPAPSAVEPAAPTQPAAAPGTRKDKARGIDKQKAKPSAPEPQPEQPVTAATPEPPDEPTQPEGEKDHGQGHDKGKGGNAEGGEG